jgi:hypothetical protein
MSVSTSTRPRVAATAVSPHLDGAAVYDCDGYRLGFVEGTDPRADRFTLVQAGYVLGLLAGTFEVPGEWIGRCSPERVDLTVPASALEEQAEDPS